MSDKTIAAISTAQGIGGIGVIRISGEDAISVADRVFTALSDNKLENSKGYTAHFGFVHSNNEKIDESIATVFRAPHSYTGEDVVELSCHGGIYVTKRVLRAVLDNGAVSADAGEFTKRAFLNGKMDLTQAEAVMDIIGAKSNAAAKSALATHEGALSKNINLIKDELVNRAAHLCAWADYPEEDIEEIEFETLKNSLKSSAEKLFSLLKNYDKGKAVREGIDTVIVGKPNVGKSTLMNLITGFDKSIVTQIAGTTRDIVEETAVVRDITLHLSDTAGIHDTDNMIEQIGVDKAKSRISTAELIIAVFDSSKELDEDDLNLLSDLKNSTCIAVINKEDLEEIDTFEFVKENVDEDLTEEDIQSASDLYEDLKVEVSEESKLLNPRNNPSMIAIMAYAEKKNMTLPQLRLWFVNYFSNNNTFLLNQKQNYLQMVASLKKGAVS